MTQPPDAPRDPVSPDPAKPAATTPGAAEDSKRSEPEPTTPQTEEQKRLAGLNSKGRVKRTRVSALWVGLVTAAILTIFLLIFIVQNSDQVAVKFLGFQGEISLAIALLLAAVIGILVVAVPGSLRIAQLGRALRKNARS